MYSVSLLSTHVDDYFKYAAAVTRDQWICAIDRSRCPLDDRSIASPSTDDRSLAVNLLTPTVALWVAYSYKASCARHLGTLTLSPERQSARMSKITNDGLTRSDTGCFIVVPIWQQWASEG